VADKDNLTSTHEWLTAVSEELGVSPDVTRKAVGPVLNMTANVAHNGPSRPAAPTTAFVLGYAAGQRLGPVETDEDSLAVVQELIGKIDDLLERYGH